MQEILKEYGSAIITVVAVISLVTILSTLLKNGDGGIVMGAFTNLLEGFYEQVNSAAGFEASPVTPGATGIVLF